MKFTTKNIGIFILWGIISAFAFKLLHPSNVVTQSIFVFVIGSIGAMVGSFFRKNN